jgi:hypothetical protein
MDEKAQRLLDISNRITEIFEDRKSGRSREAQKAAIEEALEELGAASRAVRGDLKAELVEKLGDHLLRSLRQDDHVDETLAEQLSDAIDEYRAHKGA